MGLNRRVAQPILNPAGSPKSKSLLLAPDGLQGLRGVRRVKTEQVSEKLRLSVGGVVGVRGQCPGLQAVSVLLGQEIGNEPSPSGTLKPIVERLSVALVKEVISFGLPDPIVHRIKEGEGVLGASAIHSFQQTAEPQVSIWSRLVRVDKASVEEQAVRGVREPIDLVRAVLGSALGAGSANRREAVVAGLMDLMLVRAGRKVSVQVFKADRTLPVRSRNPRSGCRDCETLVGLAEVGDVLLEGERPALGQWKPRPVREQDGSSPPVDLMGVGRHLLSVRREDD